MQTRLKLARARMPLAIGAVFIALLGPSVASAQIYKCVTPAGATEFSDSPCKNAKASDVVEVKPNTIDASEQRENLLKAENQALRDKLETRSAATSAPAVQQPAGAQAQDRIDTPACKTAQRDYQLTASSVSRTPAMLKARESIMYGACGMQEPDRQTTNVHVGKDRSKAPLYVAPQR